MICVVSPILHFDRKTLYKSPTHSPSQAVAVVVAEQAVYAAGVIPPIGEGGGNTILWNSHKEMVTKS
jgi:hypothetical protein